MRPLTALALMVVIFLVPVTALADARYFEFNPDFGQSLLVATSAQPVEQVFLPINDHMSSLDFWMSNAGTAGPATFELFSATGVLLATKTVSVPAIADSADGTRVKVILPAQVATVANQAYSVRISTSSPSLRLYFSDQQKLLAHNGIPQAAYTGGLARVGGEERGFAFKFALYESDEGTVPVISDLSASVISVQEVRLSFNASEPVDATVTYGPQGQTQNQSVPYSGQYTGCPAGIEQCSLLLSVAVAGTTHEFTLTVKDVWGNSGQATGTFTSAGVSVSPVPGPSGTTPPPVTTPAPTPDTVPPTISNARAVNITHDSVGIAWTTDEAANSLVVIQFGTDNITAGGGSDATMELEHLVTIGHLGPLTPYTARIRSSDGSGNESSANIQFSTVQVPTPGPAPSTTGTGTPAPAPAVSVGTTAGGPGGQTAQWEAPAAGAPLDGYRIDIIGPDGKLIRTIRTNDLSAELGELPDGATVIVYADNDGTYEKVGTPQTHRKSGLERLFEILPYVLAGVGTVSVFGGSGWLLIRRRRTAPPAAPEEPVGPFVSHS